MFYLVQKSGRGDWSMLRVIIFTIMIGSSSGGTVKHNMAGAVLMIGGGILQPRHEGFIHENSTEEQENTRHTSTKKLKSLERQYKKRCSNSQTTECERLLTQLIQAHSGTEKGSHLLRNAIKKIDFRLCLDGLKIEHYDTETQICCNGVFNKTSGHEECCEGEIINNQDQFCCNGNIQRKTEFSKCCGTYTYDERTHICCNEHLSERQHNSKCCGNLVYNTETELCCFDMYKFNQSQGDACCGSNVYNTMTHVCCEKNIQPAFGKKNRKGECCKDQNFHLGCYKCENDIVRPVFNESEAICCDGRVRSKRHGNDTGCCGRQVMHTGTHQCLNKEITEKTFTTHSGIHITSRETGILPSEDMDTDLSETIDDADNKETSNTSSNVILIIAVVSVVGGCGVATMLAVCFVKMRCRGKSCPFKELVRAPVRQGVTQSGHIYHGVHTRSFPMNNETEETRIHSENNNISPEVQVLIDDDVQNEYHRLNKEKINILTNIEKSNKIPNENVLTNFYKDTFTQTCPEKVSNRRTVFGKPFEHRFILGMSNATAQMPNSDVKMTLPQSLLRLNEVEVNCTSFNTVSALRKKLGLSDDEKVASPVVEYALTGCGILPDYAVVIIPFIGSIADLKVWKFQSDEGLSTEVNSVEVPLQGKTNEDMDLFYIIKDCYVYVYTKSFSGFYCTTCKHRPLRLRSFLFGSYKRFTNPLRHEVRIMIYIADELMKFADYKERMFTNENAEGRVLKKEMLLKLPAELKGDDTIQFAITPTESHCGQWIHKLYPGDTNPIYDEIQTVELYHIAEKCKNCETCHLPEHDIPYCVEWYMTNAQNVTPNYTFQCIVDVDINGNTDRAKASNRIVIDELQLRQEDRYPIEENFSARNVQGLKEYLSGGLSTDKRDAVLGALGSKYSCTGTSVEEIFFKLQEKLTPKYLLEAVGSILKEKHMFEELGVLQAYGYLPRNPISNDLHVQPVYEDSHASEATIVGQSAANSHTNIIESPGPSRSIYDDSAHATVQTKPNQTLQESQNLTQNASDNQLLASGLVRPELSRTLRMAGISRSMDDITLAKTSPPFSGARGELTTGLRFNKSREESQRVPVQEHASLDETDLKSPHRKKCDD